MKKILIISSANMDFVQRMHRLPDRGETVCETSSCSYVPGGKGANSAIAAARLGAHTVFCTCVGNDANGNALRSLYESEGIDVSYLCIDEKTPTGLASILVEEDGSNRIIVYPGANAKLTESRIKKAFACAPDAVYVQLEIPDDTVIAASRLAAKQGIPFFVDAGPARMNFPLSELEGVEIFSPNETETRIFTGLLPSDESSRLAASRILFETAKPRYVVLKLGSDGAYVFDGTEGRMIPSYPVRVADTTAAGDTFTAALALFYLDGFEIDDAVRLANCAGAISVSRKGASTSIPSLDDVKAFAAKHGVKFFKN